MNKEPLYTVRSSRIKYNSDKIVIFFAVLGICLIVFPIGKIFFASVIMYYIIKFIFFSKEKLTETVYELDFYEDRLIADSKIEILYSEIDRVRIGHKKIYIIKNIDEKTWHIYFKLGQNGGARFQEVIEIEYSSNIYQVLTKFIDVEKLTKRRVQRHILGSNSTVEPKIVIQDTLEAFGKIARYIVGIPFCVGFLILVFDILFFDMNIITSFFRGNKLENTYVFFLIIVIIIYIKKYKLVAYMFYDDFFVCKDANKDIVLKKINYYDIVDVSYIQSTHIKPKSGPVFLEIEYWTATNEIDSVIIYSEELAPIEFPMITSLIYEKLRGKDKSDEKTH